MWLVVFVRDVIKTNKVWNLFVRVFGFFGKNGIIKGKYNELW